MKRSANPLLSSPVEASGAHDRQVLLEQEDLTDASRRTYLSDLRHFIAWYEAKDVKSTDETASSQTEFDPQAITTPALTRSRTDLQKDLCQKPNSVNRALISLKRYCSWARHMQLISYDPSVPVNLVDEEEHAPRHREDEEEHALVAAVTNDGTLRDRVLLILLLHTGLRAREMCQLRRGQVKLGKQSGTLEVEGLRNTDRDVPLNATARKILEEYLPTLPPETVLLFPSRKRAAALSERALANIVKKDADEARLAAVSPHDLRQRFGYRLAEAVPLPRLAHIMGHDSLDTTRTSVQGTRTAWTARSGDHRMGITHKTSQKARRSDGTLGE